MFTEHNKLEYLYRLRDENKLLFLCDKIMKVMLQFNDKEKEARLGFIKMEHLYYKHDSLYEKIKANPKCNESEQYFFQKDTTSTTEINRLFALIVST